VSAVLLLVYRVYRCSIVVLSSVYLIIGLSFLLSSVLSVVLFVRLVLIETLLSLDHLWVRIVD
jgi:antibiotic biosynthesis monooxygenase (ABM) superfamily enzyme